MYTAVIADVAVKVTFDPCIPQMEKRLIFGWHFKQNLFSGCASVCGERAGTTVPNVSALDRLHGDFAQEWSGGEALI